MRWDKGPLDIQTDQELWDIVESNRGAIVGQQHAQIYSMSSTLPQAFLDPNKSFTVTLITVSMHYALSW